MLKNTIDKNHNTHTNTGKGELTEAKYKYTYKYKYSKRRGEVGNVSGLCIVREGV